MSDARMRKLKVEIKSFEAECPRCGESDDRSVGLNICGLCECRFVVGPSGSVQPFAYRKLIRK